MREILVPPELGENLLVVMDNCPECLDILRTVVTSLPNAQRRYFTLLHCCPPIYWEHGGGSDDDTQRNIKAVSKTEAQEFRQTRQYFDKASDILQEAGVPDSHIHTTTAAEQESLIDATMAELRRGKYSGVIVSRQHSEIISRLRGGGLTDVFRRIPKVTVWAVDTEELARTGNA
jgi:hypothetical protein